MPLEVVLDPQPHRGMHVELVQLGRADETDFLGLAAGAQFPADDAGGEADGALLANLAIVVGQ
jgi:hypothetical protein